MEGLEGQMIDILGGEHHINASNDCINASPIYKGNYEKAMTSPPPPELDEDGNFVFLPPPGYEDGKIIMPDPVKHVDESIYINIVGGKTYVNAVGLDFDGIDSNGILYIGGEAEVYTSVYGGEIFGPFSPLDADGEDMIAPGATVIATAASALNKMKVPGNDTLLELPPPVGKEKGKVYQPYIKVDIDLQLAGTEIIVNDVTGNKVISYTPNSKFSNLLITTPLIKAGDKYNIIAGNYTNTVVALDAEPGTPKCPSVPSAKEYFSSATSLKQNMIMSILLAISLMLLF